MEDKLEKAQANADLLNDKVGQQAGEAPVDPGSGNGPRRRTWEGYAADYHALSERLVEVSHAQQEALAQAKALEEKLQAKNGELKRVKAQRLKDLDRLAAVSRTRDLLEKRASAQMAKVAAALGRAGASADEASGESGSLAQPTANASPRVPATTSLTILLDNSHDRKLGWIERRWWNETIRVAQRFQKDGRLDDARATFEVALRTRQTASLWEQSGHVFRENGQFGEAEQAYKRALIMRPGKAEVMFLIGYCLEMAHRPAEALTHYEEALVADPGLVERYDHLREFHSRLER